MDTLFRLVSYQHHHHHHHHPASPADHDQQQHSFNSSTGRTTTTSSSSTKQYNNCQHHHSYYSNNSPYSSYYQYNNSQEADDDAVEECCNNNSHNSSNPHYHSGSAYMDEDDYSSSSSRHFFSSTSSYPTAGHSPGSTTVPTSTTTAAGGGYTGATGYGSSTHLPPGSGTPPYLHQWPSSSGGPYEQPQHPAPEFSNFSFPQDFNASAISFVDIFQSPSSSTSSAPHNQQQQQQAGKWASDLLLKCGRAVADRDTPRVQQLMWMLNELASPYGDTDQKLASYFLQALFARMTSSGDRCLNTLASASDRATSFDSTRRTALKFQEASPWSTFGHVASNGAILEAVEGEQRLHIVDLSGTFCTQWPTLLEALATRSSDETPSLRLTTVVASPLSSSTSSSSSSPSPSSSSVQRVMKEVGARMEKFARLMGVPFKFRFVHHMGDLSALDLDSLVGAADPDEVLAINCVNTLHSIPTRSGRETLVSAFRRLKPRVVTIVEEEADMGCADDADGSYYHQNMDVAADSAADRLFLRGFREGVRFFTSYLDSLDESFPKTSNERLALERAAGRSVVDLVSCDPAQSAERRETGAAWSRRMREAGFGPAALSDDAADDVRALLRRYKEGWSLVQAGDVDHAAAGIFLAWKEQPAVWASAWKLPP